MLDELADHLKKQPSDKAVIIGYTDNIGDEASNHHLSEERANAVRTYLINKGVNQNQLEVKGHGESQPVESNETNEGRFKNRRVEILILAG